VDGRPTLWLPQPDTLLHDRSLSTPLKAASAS
jgi:hypothetical protein